MQIKLQESRSEYTVRALTHKEAIDEVRRRSSFPGGVQCISEGGFSKRDLDSRGSPSTNLTFPNFVSLSTSGKSFHILLTHIANVWRAPTDNHHHPNLHRKSYSLLCRQFLMRNDPFVFSDVSQGLELQKKGPKRVKFYAEFDVSSYVYT